MATRVDGEHLLAGLAIALANRRLAAPAARPVTAMVEQVDD
jgi:hypothetical protein